MAALERERGLFLHQRAFVVWEANLAEVSLVLGGMDDCFFSCAGVFAKHADAEAYVNVADQRDPQRCEHFARRVAVEPSKTEEEWRIAMREQREEQDQTGERAQQASTAKSGE